MSAAILLAILLTAGPDADAKKDAAAAAAPPPPDRAALVAGKLPDEPGRAVVQGKCLICHSVEYVTTQRLTPAQWQKTVDKMRKFGAPLTDEDVKVLSDYLGRNWTADLPERRPEPVAAPPGSAGPR